MDPISSRDSLAKIRVCEAHSPDLEKWTSEAKIVHHERKAEMKRQIIRVEPLASLLEKYNAPTSRSSAMATPST